MDETDSPQNRSNDEAELSKSMDENSFIGKMKFGVSKILPNSLSKWLSPKVDARRRRHEEMDSEDESTNRNDLPLAALAGSHYQDTPQLAAPPPNKKKKIFTDFLNRNTIDLYSPAVTPLIGERSNIVSSTLIEDVPNRTNDQFNRYLPIENGRCDESPRDNASNYPDEGSSSQSREKAPTNIFAINNDSSSVVNFSAHLQRAKSLFTNRSYLSPRLKNYRMRNPRSSLYRSTSSLCDNNSVSSNASSAMSSPFYNGSTTYGGASAMSRRINTTLNHDSQMHHRPKVPTNLVASRSTSSLNSVGGSSASMSTTAKRILDVMSKYNTPLTEVRRISNALPSISESNALNKRKSILELDTSTNELDKSKRTLLKPNTPYNRPFGRTPIESILTTELHVPSMPELLQLKKFATNTMKIRDIASKSDSILNKPIAAPTNEFNFMAKTTNRTADGDLDASNNNKFVNNKNDTISNSANDANKPHINKIRSNITKRKVGKRVDEDTLPEPVNLPNSPLILDKKAELKFFEPFKLQNSDQKSQDNSIQIPFKFKSSNTSALVTPAIKEKRTNGNDSLATKKFEISPMKSVVTAPSTVAAKSDFTFEPQPVQHKTKTFVYRFSEPLFVNSTDNSFGQSKISSEKSNYKFSEPTFLDDMIDGSTKTEPVKSFSNFKFESKPIKGVSSDSGIAETTQSFESNASKSAGTIATKSTLADNGISAGKSVSSLSTQLKEDDTFKSLVVKQKQGKWECKDCMASNDSSANKCLCCGAANKDSSTTKSSGGPTADTGKPAVVDDIFKSIVAKQKQSKWDCEDCMSQNDQALAKCACCGGANPNASSSNVTVNSTAVPKSTFSFGSFPASSTSATPAAFKPVDSVFKAIVDKQKNQWECSACLSSNDVTKSKCECCEQSRDVSKGASEFITPKSQFSFGNKEAFAPKSTFSFGSNSNVAVSAAPTFSFGNLPDSTTDQSTIEKSNESTSTNGKNKEDKSKESVQNKPITSQFSFGNSAALPSTSKIETKPTPAATAAAASVAPVASDNVFKSIVDKQKSSSWECPSCMTKNSNDVEKCACCSTPKDGSAATNSAKNDLGLSSSQKFVFGSQSSSSAFSFGSKPSENRPSFQFGSPSSSTTTTSTPTPSLTSTVAAAPATTVSTTPSLFGSSSLTPSFSFGAMKPATTASAAPSQPASFGGFQFSSPTNTPIFGSKVESKDVTDGGPTANANSSNKGITLLENVLVKPATNGPVDAPKPMFTFGQNSTNPSIDDSATKAKKRPNTDLAEGNFSIKVPATSSTSNTSFVFGQPSNANNTFSAIAAKPTTDASQSTNAQTIQKPTFAFGMNKSSTNAFPTVQPSFSANPSFSFGASNTATTSAPSTFGSVAAPAPASTPSQPVFGSNTFSSPTPALPTLSGFKGTSFGSSTPSFGAPNLNTEPQQQATPSPGLFQFSANDNSAPSAPLSSEPPKPAGGFNFSMNTAPTFNFSEQNTQQQISQQNVPFQFGAMSEKPNLFAAPPTSASTTAIQQRRKLRPVRRVNRP